MKILTRKHYADKVDSWIGKGNIIVLVGPRRVGKSYILKDFIERHSQEEDINVIYVDKEKKAFKNIKTKEDLDTILRAFICQESIIVSWLTRFNRLKGLKKASAFGTSRIILM